jgi:hypothetical protein
MWVGRDHRTRRYGDRVAQRLGVIATVIIG